MNVEFRTIDKNNYADCINLTTTEEQKHFVASNVFSLVQAAYEPNLYPLGVYWKDKMVGFILFDFDETICGWSMSRFMIDQNYQHQGIGRQALKQFIDFFVREVGHVPLYTSAEVTNPVAIALYESMGFLKGDVFEYEFGGIQYREVRMKLSF